MSPGLGSAISIFSVGLVSGRVSGLLMEAAAAVVLQSPELLADNRLLMDQLEKYIADGCYFSIKVGVPDIQISIFAVMFGVFSATFYHDWIINIFTRDQKRRWSSNGEGSGCCWNNVSHGCDSNMIHSGLHFPKIHIHYF